MIFRRPLSLAKPCGGLQFYASLCPGLSDLVERQFTSKRSLPDTLYQPPLMRTCVGPIPKADGRDAPGGIEDSVPGVAGGIENGVVGLEHPIGEESLAQELPEVLDRVAAARPLTGTTPANAAAAAAGRGWRESAVWTWCASRRGRAARPRARDLLAEPHLILEPHLERRARGQRAHDLRQALGELFLNAAMSSGF